jgi:hypothetical protein
MKGRIKWEWRRTIHSSNEGFATVWVAMGSGDSNFATSMTVTSLCSLVSVALKEEKETTNKEG